MNARLTWESGLRYYSSWGQAGQPIWAMGTLSLRERPSSVLDLFPRVYRSEDAPAPHVRYHGSTIEPRGQTTGEHDRGWFSGYRDCWPRRCFLSFRRHLVHVHWSSWCGQLQNLGSPIHVLIVSSMKSIILLEVLEKTKVAAVESPGR
jgi:hypothetical protein